MLADILQSVTKVTRLSHLEPDVRQHLTRVYACLTATSVAATVGALTYLYINVYAVNLLSFIGTLGCLIAVSAYHNDESNLNKRFGFLMGLGFFSGLGCGPLIEYSLHLNPSIIVSALTCSIFVFASFSITSLFAKRGQFLLLGGPLSTLVTTILALSLANLLFGVQLLYRINFYLGLLLMCGFILFDTTVIVEKARLGNKDFIAHTCDLFLDLISLFKRLLILFARRGRSPVKQPEEEEEQQNRRRR